MCEASMLMALSPIIFGGTWRRHNPDQPWWEKTKQIKTINDIVRYWRRRACIGRIKRACMKTHHDRIVMKNIVNYWSGYRRDGMNRKRTRPCLVPFVMKRLTFLLGLKTICNVSKIKNISMLIYTRIAGIIVEIGNMKNNTRFRQYITKYPLVAGSIQNMLEQFNTVLNLIHGVHLDTEIDCKIKVPKNGITRLNITNFMLRLNRHGDAFNTLDLFVYMFSSLVLSFQYWTDVVNMQQRHSQMSPVLKTYLNDKYTLITDMLLNEAIGDNPDPTTYSVATLYLALNMTVTEFCVHYPIINRYCKKYIVDFDKFATEEGFEISPFNPSVVDMAGWRANTKSITRQFCLYAMAAKIRVGMLDVELMNAASDISSSMSMFHRNMLSQLAADSTQDFIADLMKYGKFGQQWICNLYLASLRKLGVDEKKGQFHYYRTNTPIDGIMRINLPTPTPVSAPTPTPTPTRLSISTTPTTSAFSPKTSTTPKSPKSPKSTKK